MKRLLFFFCLTSNVLFAQNEIYHVEPPMWWHEMENNELEILIHGENISGLPSKVTDSNITIISTTPGDSPNYQFILLDISKVQSDTNFEIILNNGKKDISIPYSLSSKRSLEDRNKGLSQKDAIYLITPDRFRNGNVKNDEVDVLKEKINRKNEYGRHGGDIEGIIQSLDYIKGLGFTSIWLNPVLENNMKSQSYHGYAVTDYYSVDERFGGNYAYESLKNTLQEKGLSLIMDMIANHCGSEHWWMEDLPFQDWINYQDDFLNDKKSFNKLTNHRKSTLVDPYATTTDRNRMTDGWFVPTMPDLNQQNKHMSRYIIQNSIWWVEVMNLAGIRQDTYSYPDEDFLSDWSCALVTEFPNLFIVGEEWTDNPLISSYWQFSDKKVNELSSSTTCLPSVMDFPLQMTVNKALTDTETWNTGLPKMYEILANDILYSHPEKLVIFPDNHDMSRIFTQVNEDYQLWKMAMIYYATMRGIPQIYYGTEIVMSNKGTDSHGVIRTEFPGGWTDHDKNSFTGANLTAQEANALSFTKTLYNWRKSCNAIHEGKLLHYIPENGVYVYFRIHNEETIMVAINKNENPVKLDLAKYQEVIEDFQVDRNVLLPDSMLKKSEVLLPKMDAVILSFKRNK